MLYDPSFIKIRIFIIVYIERKKKPTEISRWWEWNWCHFLYNFSYFLNFFFHNLLAHIIWKHFQILPPYLDISKIFNCDQKLPFFFWIPKGKRRGQEIGVCICNSGLKLQQQRFYQHQQRVEVKGKEPEEIIENKIIG